MLLIVIIENKWLRRWREPPIQSFPCRTDRNARFFVAARSSFEKTLLTLVMIGVGVDGKKELIAMEGGIRESAQNWREILFDAA